MFIALVIGCHASLAKIELAEPFLAKAGGQVIKVDIGHSAPILADYDGDGLKDLLVGQFGEGKLRIYKNVGSAAEPKFDKFEWLQAGGEIAQVGAS